MNDLISRTKVCQFIATMQLGFDPEGEAMTMTDADVFKFLEEIYNYVGQMPAEVENG